MTATTNAEGVITIAVGDEDDGLVVTVIPASGDEPMRIEIEGRGPAVIADGGIRLDRGLAAVLAAELFGVLTG